jgi:TonB family protein
MSRLLLMIFAFCFGVHSAVFQTDTPLPTVTAFDCPKYPQKAQSMRLQGMVRMEVTTDGHQVSNVKLLPSHPVLAEEAVKNVRTWRFADHHPTSFIVTYFYVNEGDYKKDPATNCSAKMELPEKVTVSTKF